MEHIILDRIKIISDERSYALPSNIKGRLTLFPNKIDLFIDEFPFYDGAWELNKYISGKKGMFTVEAVSEEGVKIRLEKCTEYKWGTMFPGKAAPPELRAKITGIGITSLNAKWYYSS